MAAGPIVAALAGAGALGAVGGMIGALAGMGIPEYEAKRYEGRLREGGVLLSVHCDNDEWVKRAKIMLRQTGGQDIASAGEEPGRLRQRGQTTAARAHDGRRLSARRRGLRRRHDHPVVPEAR